MAAGAQLVGGKRPYNRHRYAPGARWPGRGIVGTPVQRTAFATQRNEEAGSLTFVLNVIVSAVMISFASWLSGRLPAAAGFFVALPLATMLVLPLSYAEHGSAESSILLAKSIFIAIPISLAFFVPFLLSDRLGLSFWQAYFLGCLALPVGFFLHRAAARFLFT